MSVSREGTELGTSSSSTFGSHLQFLLLTGGGKRRRDDYVRVACWQPVIVEGRSRTECQILVIDEQLLWFDIGSVGVANLSLQPSSCCVLKKQEWPNCTWLSWVREPIRQEDERWQIRCCSGKDHRVYTANFCLFLRWMEICI